MEKIGRRVVQYHPEIRVRRGDRVVVISADLEDWCEDREVLDKLAVGYPDCRTVGDLVEAIEHGDGEPHPPLPLRDTGVMSCRILEMDAAIHSAETPVRDWDEPI
jgi:hypothetical protein